MGATLVVYFFLLSCFREASGQSDSIKAHTSYDHEAKRGELRLMWYNAENLFHPDNAPGPGDDEFTPEGVRRWSYGRYQQKLTALARVIVAAGHWQPPELVGLCEVENAQVLEDLVSHPILAHYGYSYLHRDGPDHRGMDLACLFRQDRFGLVDWQFMDPVKEEGKDSTREMLYLHGGWGRRDSLHLVLVHFISRYRGAGETAAYRRRQAGRLSELLDSLSSEHPEHLVMAAGDFNDSRDGWSMEPLSDLVGEPPDHVFSYKYRDRWNSIDFFLLGGRPEGYDVGGAVFNLPALMEADLVYGGLKPKRTYVAYSYWGGYSDHLPVLLDISPERYFLDFSP